MSESFEFSLKPQFKIEKTKASAEMPSIAEPAKGRVPDVDQTAKNTADKIEICANLCIENLFNFFGYRIYNVADIFPFEYFF